MAFLFKRSNDSTEVGAETEPTIDGPRISNAGRWPVRVTDFLLSEPYEQPPVDYLEIFFVRGGSFLHESEAGKQTLRKGSIIVSHARNRQALKHPENCYLSRVRFLPEWLTEEFHSLIESPFTVAAIVGTQLFHLPDKDSIHVFSARPERYDHLLSDVDLLRDLLLEATATDALTRSTLVKILLQVGEEFGNFLRHRGGVDLPDACRRHFARVENRLNQANDSNELADIEAGLVETEEIEEFTALFRKHTGLSPDEYLQRRRIDHAAHRLLTSEQRAGTIAKELGFSDAANLTRQFETRHRVSPAVYRQKFAPPPA